MVKNAYRCTCTHEELLKGAYWWSMPEWVYNHPGRTAADYLGYINSTSQKPKEFFKPARDYLTYPKGISRRCGPSKLKLKDAVNEKYVEKR